MNAVAKSSNNNKTVKPIFNEALAKLIGVHTVLNPETLIFRNYSVIHMIILLGVLYSLPLSILFFSVSAYYSTCDSNVATLSFAHAENLFHTCFKILTIVYYHKEIWKCMKIAYYVPSGRGPRNAQIREYWRTRAVIFTNFFFVMNGLCVFYCDVSPLIHNNTYVSVRSHHGTSDNYRMNVVNLYFFFSNETYNNYFTIFHVIEVLYLTICAYFVNFADLVILTISFAITCQLQTVCEAFESLGHSNVFSDFSDFKLKTRNENNTLYEEFKIILKDHQYILIKLEEFLAVFRPVLLSQIFISATTLVVLSFIITMNFMEGVTVDTGTTIKMFFAFPMFLFQLFMTCYLFDGIHSQKDAIVFALYSINWTEMDLKCKKLVLTAIKMNNANQMKLKFSSMNVVNLEMFYKTVRVCHSVLSMLVNTTTKTQTQS